MFNGLQPLERMFLCCFKIGSFQTCWLTNLMPSAMVRAIAWLKRFGRLPQSIRQLLAIEQVRHGFKALFNVSLLGVLRRSHAQETETVDIKIDVPTRNKPIL